VHGHLRGGAVLASVAGAAALLAAAGVADHVHRVHAPVGQVLALAEGAGGRRGAEEAPLRLLGAGGQPGGGGEVVPVQVVGVVQGEGVVGALLHVVVAAAAEHVGGGGARRRGGGAAAAARLHHVLKLGGREGAQLAAVGVHLGSAGVQGGSPLRQEGVGRLSGRPAARRLQPAVGAVGQAAVALQRRHVAAGAGRVLQAQAAQLALPAAHVEAAGRQVEGGRRAGGRQQVGGAGGGGGPGAGGGGRGARAAACTQTHSQHLEMAAGPKLK